MSILRRISLVLRSYIKTTSARLDDIAAEEELREAKARKNAIDEAKALNVPITSPAKAVDTSLIADYRVLGLQPNSDIKEVEAAWRNLASRADPKRFPEGSEEEKRAARLLESINASYARIREALNPTEGRFGQLEL